MINYRYLKLKAGMIMLSCSALLLCGSTSHATTNLPQKAADFFLTVDADRAVVREGEIINLIYTIITSKSGLFKGFADKGVFTGFDVHLQQDRRRTAPQVIRHMGRQYHAVEVMRTRLVAKNPGKRKIYPGSIEFLVDGNPPFNAIIGSDPIEVEILPVSELLSGPGQEMLRFNELQKVPYPGVEYPVVDVTDDYAVTNLDMHLVRTKIEEEVSLKNCHRHRAREYLAARAFESILKDYAQCVENNPQHVEAKLGLATMYLMQKHYDLALAMYKEAHSMRPDDPYIIEQVGDAYYLSGNPSAGQESYEKAIEHGIWYTKELKSKMQHIARLKDAAAIRAHILRGHTGFIVREGFCVGFLIPERMRYMESEIHYSNPNPDRQFVAQMDMAEIKRSFDKASLVRNHILDQMAKLNELREKPLREYKRLKRELRDADRAETVLLNKQIENLQSDLFARELPVRKAISSMADALEAVMLNDIRAAIHEIAQDRGYTLVISPAQMVGEHEDITDDVINKLNADSSKPYPVERFL